MKILLLRAFSYLAAAFILQTTAGAADTNPPPRLTVELRDGSRVVGTCVQDNVRFHSALLGDLKLAVRDISAVDCASTNAAKLTSVNGDTLTVGFAEAALPVKTSFGRVELAAETIRKFTVMSSGKSGLRRDGLVLFWAGDGEGKNDFGTDPTTALRFSDGGVVMVSNKAALVSMQQTRQLTFEAWIKPASVPHEFPVLLAKGGNQPDHAYGGYEFLLNANGDNDLIFASGACLIDTHRANGSLINNHLGEWIHIAFTMDDRTKAAKFYVNGKPANDEFDYGSYSNSNTEINFNLPNHLYIGSPDPITQAAAAKFDGELRDVLLFNRALSADEIRADCESSRPQ